MLSLSCQRTISCLALHMFYLITEPRLTDQLRYGEVALVMAELKELVQETRSSLQDLEILLVNNEEPGPSFVQANGTWLQLRSKLTLKRLSKRLKNCPIVSVRKKILQQSEIRNIHVQVEKVLVKIERIIHQLDTVPDCNSQELGQTQRRWPGAGSERRRSGKQN